MVLVLGIVKASLEILGIGIGVKKVVLLMSAAQPLLCSTILMRVMTVFLFVLTQKRVMAPFNDSVLGLMRVMCGT